MKAIEPPRRQARGERRASGWESVSNRWDGLAARRTPYEVLIVPRDDWTDLPGRLFVLSGPSGVGKSTLMRRIMERTDLRVRPSISATTRAPRPGERDGVDYDFMSREAFEAARDRGEFLEWAEVHGHLYGTPVASVRQLLAQGLCVVLVIDVQGGRQVSARVPNAVLLLVKPSNLEELEARLRARGTDDEPTIQRRLENARREIEEAEGFYPHELFNESDKLEDSVSMLAFHLMQNGCGG
jgi:guanylate kinase